MPGWRSPADLLQSGPGAEPSKQIARQRVALWVAGAETGGITTGLVHKEQCIVNG
ncbi:MAG: hypothetical protein RL215_3492 [Planctomycetota bacterium]|jgi:hypothetical protein